MIIAERMLKETGIMKSITLPATLENMDDVLDFVNGVLEEHDCPMKASMTIAIAVEEIFVNIAHYAYPSGEGEATVCCEVEQGERPCAVIRLSDSGIPYNPLAHEDPDVTLSAEERKIGGLGIYMVKKSMDSVEYQHQDGQNVLTLRKFL